MKTFIDGITQYSKVKLVTPAPGGELFVGDTGVVTACWNNRNVLVRWNKDEGLRLIHRKRLKLEKDQ